ncbi:MAG: AI-2E family transporter [Candidatus Choladocola sp.]|nr:AI-2E family transporter [Candidatus Choladocola sp.]
MNRKSIGIAVLAVLACLCVKYSDSFLKSFLLVISAMKPLIYGGILAYIFNILMKKLEKIYFPKNDAVWVKKTRRPVCVFGSIFLVLFAVIVLILIVVPALGDSVYVLTKDIPKAFTRFQKWLSALLGEAGLSEIQSYVSGLQIDWNSLFQKLGDFMSKGIGSLFSSAFSMANLLAGFTFTGIISIIFSIYILFQKDNLKRQLKKAARVYVPDSWCTACGEFLHLAHETFTSYITGQVLEAVILGSLCAAGMMILKIPYAAMIGVTVGATALIPVMGAYIGAAVGAFMILTVSPLKALVFIVYLVILQQVEGNLIYPKVVGGSIGLPGIWVLAAVTVGGGLLGIPGMLIGVPFTATVYKWIRKDVNKREKQHNRPELLEKLEKDLHRIHDAALDRKDGKDV